MKYATLAYIHGLLREETEQTRQFYNWAVQDHKPEDLTREYKEKYDRAYHALQDFETHEFR